MLQDILVNRQFEEFLPHKVLCCHLTHMRKFINLWKSEHNRDKTVQGKFMSPYKDAIRQQEKHKSIPFGLMFSRTKVSSSGSFLRISAATGSGGTPCRSPATLWVRIILDAATEICSPLEVFWFGKSLNRLLHSGTCSL